MEDKEKISDIIPQDSSLEEKKKGQALKKWTVFFFVLSCIATFIVGASLALPFFLTVFGIISIIVWLVVLVVFTVFTLGLIWLSDDTKKINGSWMSFNDTLFNSGNAASDFVIKAFPIISIAGCFIVLMTWVFIIFGLVLNKKKTKFYKAMLIVLSVITFIFIAITIISGIIISKQITTNQSN